MHTRSLLAGLFLAAAQLSPCCIGAATAGPIAAGTAITGQASSGALLSLDDGYSTAANPNHATLSDGFGDVEFLSDDFNFFFDFQSDGSLSLYGLADGLSNTFTFDLAGLPGNLARADLDAPVQGLRLEVLGTQTLRVSFEGTVFASDGSPYVAHLVVPEPGAAALSLLALALVALNRRARKA